MKAIGNSELINKPWLSVHNATILGVSDPAGLEGKELVSVPGRQTRGGFDPSLAIPVAQLDHMALLCC